MFQLNQAVFGSLNSKADYDRQKEELMRKKRMQDLQVQAMEQQLQPQPEQLSLEGVLGKAQMQGYESLTPEEQQMLLGADVKQMAKQTVDARGNVISNRSYRDLLGMPPQDFMSIPTNIPQQQNIQGMPIPVAQQQDSLPQIPVQQQEISMQGLSPYVREDIIKQGLEQQQKQQLEKQGQRPVSYTHLTLPTILRV